MGQRYQGIILARMLVFGAVLMLAAGCAPGLRGGASQGVQLWLPATVAWQPTGIVVQAGETLRFHSEGRWAVAPAAERERWPDTGPEGHGGHPGERVHAAGDGKKELPGTPFGTLLGKVGGTVFAIGARRDVVMPSSGELFLVINDYPFYRHDNRGALTVRIERP